MRRSRKPIKRLAGSALAGGLALTSLSAFAECPATYDDLTDALQDSIAPTGGPSNGGFDLNMWATIVDRTGTVCLVTRSAALGEQWPGSRVISAQKANTANAFSLPGFALSTANLFTAVQPGNSLFGLQESNPVDTSVAYEDLANNWGTKDDPMVGDRIGGINVFGGGLALYDEDGVLVGGLGVSGDSSCADHNVAWRVRAALGLDNVPGGPNNGDDGIIYDIQGSNPGNSKSGFDHPVSPSGFGHPTCGGTEDQIAVAIGAGSAP